MRFTFMSLVLALCVMPVQADPVSFGDYKFVDVGMSEAEVYLRLGSPDYTVPVEGTSIRYDVHGRRIEDYRYTFKTDAVWYGDGGSIPSTIITFKNGKVDKRERTKAKVHSQKKKEEVTIYHGY